LDADSFFVAQGLGLLCFGVLFHLGNLFFHRDVLLFQLFCDGGIIADSALLE
jgi:hypothetical protein